MLCHIAKLTMHSQNLDKICRCGTQACRYKDRDQGAQKVIEAS